MFNFQDFLINHHEFEHLAELLVKNPTIYATSKIVAGKVNLPLQPPLKPDAVFRNQRANKG